jgi:hypothetical protein
MTKIKVTFNKEYDIQRVINTIKRLDWYTENNYNYKNISFPKMLNKEKIKDYSDKEIEDAVIAEYSDNLYKENEKFLLDNWASISEEIKFAFSRSGLLLQDEYKVYLTKYGMGGSYDLPNVVIINLINSFRVGMLKTIIHEIIHLGIQKYVDEYKINQGQKERIVDLFFLKNFPRRVFTQNVYMSMNTEKSDQIFDDNFPDMKAVIEKISK